MMGHLLNPTSRIYADRHIGWGGSNGDGAQRGTVTIPVLAPYGNQPANTENIIVASL